MRTVTTTLAVSALTLCAAVSLAQVKSTAENGLVGIKLYDQGLRVVQMYGTPDDIQPVSFGGGNIGPSGGGGAGRGPGAPGAGGGGGRMGGGGKNGFSPSAGSGWTSDYSFENDALFRQASGQMQPAPQGRGIAPGDGPAPGGGGGGGGARMGGGGGSGERVVFTRWIYKRGGSRYGFIIDRGNRVVQIEAIGLFNKKVRTKKGVGFGATFAELIKKYRTPDGYEIAGEQIVVRFLSRSKVAFRLSRLGPDKPHVVTGVVVAAGKA